MSSVCVQYGTVLFENYQTAVKKASGSQPLHFAAGESTPVISWKLCVRKLERSIWQKFDFCSNFRLQWILIIVRLYRQIQQRGA